ncbi:MAG: beta-lactamase family protein [Cytophagaceae bacterium]|nr:beta-lactamase family protein [Gemmatimonadaceae bacterium]
MTASPLVRLALFGALCLPAAVAGAQATARHARAIDAYARTHGFNGTILVRHKGAVVYHKSFGIADRAFSVPVTNDTKFRIASITKVFTAVLVLQLVEQGRLDLDATIRTYLPAYTGAGADRVTLHHLLRHVSGIQNMDTVSSFQAAVAHGIEVYQRPLTTDALLARYASGALVHDPGSTFDYNNAEYIILGKVIEAVEGKPFDVVLRDRILTPLGLRNSGMTRQAELLPRLAPTYFRRPDTKEMINDLPVYIDNWYAAGAMYATGADLGRFAAALYERSLLTPASRERLLTPGLDKYGYGLWVDSITIGGKRERIAYRPGSIMGANTALYRVVDRDVTVIILSNTNVTDIDEFAPWIARTILVDRKPVHPVRPSTRPIPGPAS